MPEWTATDWLLAWTCLMLTITLILSVLRGRR